MSKRVLRWNVFVSRSKKKAYAAQYNEYQIDVNLTNHNKDKPVADVTHSYDHELFHHLIDIAVHPMKISARKQHFIIRKMLEDFH